MNTLSRRRARLDRLSAAVLVGSGAAAVLFAAPLPTLGDTLSGMVFTSPRFVSFLRSKPGQIGNTRILADRQSDKEDTQVTNARPLLDVKTFRDMGGAAARGPDGQPLYLRFTQAVRKDIADRVGKQIGITGMIREDKTKSNPDRYSLEGDLSRVEASEDDKGSAYLCVLRLFREGKTRRIVAQWAGTADSLRDLTGNLPNDPAISPNGLSGELGKRVAATLAGEGGTAFAEMVKVASSPRRLSVEVVSESSIQSNQERHLTLSKSAGFRLRVTAQDQGVVYLAQMEANGKATAIYAPDKPVEAAPGRPVLLPPDKPLLLPVSAIGQSTEYVVLLRKGKRVAQESPERGRENNALRGGVLREAQFGAGQAAANDAEVPTERMHAVRVLDADPHLSNAMDATLARLLQMYQTDPPGTWTAIRVQVSAKSKR